MAAGVEELQHRGSDGNGCCSDEEEQEGGGGGGGGDVGYYFWKLLPLSLPFSNASSSPRCSRADITWL